jgi:hypothetical protein
MVSRIYRSRQLIPNLQLITVWVATKQIWLAWAKLAVVENSSSGCFDRSHRPFDVCGVDQTKSKMYDASSAASPIWISLKNERVARAGSLRLNEVFLFIDRDRTKHFLVEAQ